MFKKFISSTSFPFFVRGIEAIAILVIVLISLVNPTFGYIEAALFSSVLILVIEFIYTQKMSSDSARKLGEEIKGLNGKIENIKSNFDTRFSEAEKTLTNGNDVLRAIEQCGLEPDDVKELITKYSDIADKRHPMLKRIAEYQILELGKSLHNLEQGRFEYSRGDKFSFGRVGVFLAKEHLDCVSSFDGVVGEFWTDKQASKIYMAAMEKALHEGVRIRRIFYHHEQLTEAQVAVCREQHDMGVDISLIDASIPGNMPVKECCFLIADERIVANTVFQRNGRIDHWELLDIKEKRDELRQDFKKLLDRSVALEDILDMETEH